MISGIYTNSLAKPMCVTVALLLLMLAAAATYAADVYRNRVMAHPEAPFPYAASDHVALPDSVVTSLGNLVADWVDRGQIVGAEVLVVRRDTIIWHELFGLRDLETGEPLPAAGIFRIRSMTKPFIGTAAFRLVESGKLALDDPVSKYIPSFNTAWARHITVRQVMAHTAGFDFSPFPRDRTSYTSLRESVDDLANVVPQREEGLFYYSDGGSATLGAVVEAAAGMSLEAYLKAEVFAPLGLRETYTAHDPATAWSTQLNSTHRWDRDTRQHQRYWSPDQPQQLSYFRASGGIYSTVFDYAVFLNSWRNALAGTDQSFLTQATAQTALRQITESAYGLQWEIVDSPEGGPALFGHGGSDGTMGLCLPKQDLLVLFFTQSRGCDCRDQFAMLAGLSGQFGPLAECTAWGQWREPAPTIKPIQLGEEQRARFVGIYDVDGETIEIRDVDGHLRLLRGVSAPQNPPGSMDTIHSTPSVVCRPVLALPFAETDLIPTGPNSFHFGRVENNIVRELYWPGHDIRFVTSGDEVVGYEIEYDPQVIERARKYQWRLADPAPRRERLPENLIESINGTYESGRFGTIDVTAEFDLVELRYGNTVDTILYQGAGFFVNSYGDLITFVRDFATTRWQLRVIENSGYVYEFERLE